MHSPYRGWVLQGIVDLRLPQEHVAAAGAPQHALEGGDAFAQDHAGDEPKGAAGEWMVT